MINGEISRCRQKNQEMLSRRQSRKNKQKKRKRKQENAVRMLMHRAFIHRQKENRRENARQRLESSRVMYFIQKCRCSRIVYQRWSSSPRILGSRDAPPDPPDRFLNPSFIPIFFQGFSVRSLGLIGSPAGGVVGGVIGSSAVGLD